MSNVNIDLETGVLAADEARYQALYAQDIAALDNLLVDDYVHTHANGKVDDKAAFLASIRAAKYRFVNAVRTDQRVRILGSVAVLNGKTKTEIETGGEFKVMNNAFVTVWTLVNSELKLIHWQATKLPEN